MTYGYNHPTELAYQNQQARICNEDEARARRGRFDDPSRDEPRMEPNMKTSMTRLAKADWHGIEKDVVERIRVLHATAKAMANPPHNVEVADKIANDLILPNMKLLATFCTNIDMDDADLVKGGE